MFKKIFGKKDNSEQATIREEKLNSLREKAFAANENTLAIPQFEDLDEHQFLKLLLIGPLNVKTFNGGVVRFNSNSKEVEYDIDNYEIATEYSSKLGIGVTEIDLTMDDEMRKLIEDEKLLTLKIDIKKKSFDMEIINQKLLQEAISPIIPDFEVEYEEILGNKEEE